MFNTQKTSADIIKELRYSITPKHRTDHELLALYADRLEAAIKRDIDDAERRGYHAATKAVCETIEKVGPLYDAESVGNAAAMREALVKIRRKIDLFTKDKDVLCADPQELNTQLFMAFALFSSLIDAALAAPQRNCDRFTTVKDAAIAFARERQDAPHPCPDFTFSAWLFAPATEKKGGAE